MPRLTLLRERFTELFKQARAHGRLAEAQKRRGVGDLVGHRPAHTLLTLIQLYSAHRKQQALSLQVLLFTYSDLFTQSPQRLFSL